MDLIKKLTGKDPLEYEPVAKALVNNSDTELFAKLVKQDDFLFNFIKENVAKRIKMACNKENHLNLLKFLDYYSPSYDSMIAEVLYNFSGESLADVMKEFFLYGTNSQKAYALKYFSFVNKELLEDITEKIREASGSDNDAVSVNAIELLSNMGDVISKNFALEKLNSKDEFVQYDGINFLVIYQAKDALGKIVEVMKKSSLAENIAAQIPYLIDFNEFLEKDTDSAIFTLCNIINAIPEIISPSCVIDYSLNEIFTKLINNNITSSSAVLLRMAKDKFFELTNNEEYLFDCDKNTKDEVKNICNNLQQLDTAKLNSLLYDELYEESDFVFFALDYVNEVAELEALLDSANQTLLTKVLTLLKEKNALSQEHKTLAIKNLTDENLKQFAEAL